MVRISDKYPRALPVRFLPLRIPALSQQDPEGVLQACTADVLKNGGHFARRSLLYSTMVPPGLTGLCHREGEPPWDSGQRWINALPGFGVAK